MDVWVGEWMYVCACMVDGMYGWVSGCMGGWVDVYTCMYGRWDVWVGEWMYVHVWWMGCVCMVWIDGLVDCGWCVCV